MANIKMILLFKKYTFSLVCSEKIDENAFRSVIYAKKLDINHLKKYYPGSQTQSSVSLYP